MSARACFHGVPMALREVQIARSAFVDGNAFFADRRPALDEARQRYPLPKVTRPRVVPDPHSSTLEWRVSEVGVEYRRIVEGLASSHWIRSERCVHLEVTAQRVQLWADLFANPSEEVEEGSP